jgi:hypothetical protein
MALILHDAAMIFTDHIEARCGSDNALSQWSLYQETPRVVSINNTPDFKNGEIFFCSELIYSRVKESILIIQSERVDPALPCLIDMRGRKKPSGQSINTPPAFHYY